MSWFLFGQENSEVLTKNWQQIIKVAIQSTFGEMAPRAAYWNYFQKNGNKAHCKLGGCNNPIVSLGKEDVPGEKKKKSW